MGRALSNRDLIAFEGCRDQRRGVDRSRFERLANVVGAAARAAGAQIAAQPDERAPGRLDRNGDAQPGERRNPAAQLVGDLVRRNRERRKRVGVDCRRDLDHRREERPLQVYRRPQVGAPLEHGRPATLGAGEQIGRKFRRYSDITHGRRAVYQARMLL